MVSSGSAGAVEAGGVSVWMFPLSKQVVTWVTVTLRH